MALDDPAYLLLHGGDETDAYDFGEDDFGEDDFGEDGFGEETLGGGAQKTSRKSAQKAHPIGSSNSDEKLLDLRDWHDDLTEFCRSHKLMGTAATIIVGGYASDSDVEAEDKAEDETEAEDKAEDKTETEAEDKAEDETEDKAELKDASGTKGMDQATDASNILLSSIIDRGVLRSNNVKSRKVIPEPVARHYLHSWHGISTKPQQGPIIDLQAQEYDASYLHLNSLYNPFTNSAFGGAVIEKGCGCDAESGDDAESGKGAESGDDANSSENVELSEDAKLGDVTADIEVADADKNMGILTHISDSNGIFGLVIKK
jgi:hypothetical protein